MQFSKLERGVGSFILAGSRYRIFYDGILRITNIYSFLFSKTFHYTMNIAH